MNEDVYVVHTDGGARGNPGPSAVGVVITHAGLVVDELSEYIGDTTNNVAEYTALIRACEILRDRGAGSAHFYLDSELVVKQVRGEYKVRDEGLKPLHAQVKGYLSDMEFTINHIPRALNKRADELVNQALDQRR